MSDQQRDDALHRLALAVREGLAQGDLADRKATFVSLLREAGYPVEARERKFPTATGPGGMPYSPEGMAGDPDV